MTTPGKFKMGDSQQANTNGFAVTRRNKIGTAILAFMIVLLAVSTLTAADIADWQLSSVAGQTSATAAPYDANLASAPILGLGVTEKQTFCVSSVSCNNNSADSTLAASVANNDYLTFTITPKTGYQASVQSISFYTAQQGSGGSTPVTYYLLSSATGFNAGSSLGSVTTNTCPSSMQTIALGSPLVVTGSGVEFRLYFVEPPAGKSNAVGIAYIASTYTLQVAGAVGLAPAIAYQSNPSVYIVNSAGADTLVNTGGAADSFSVTPALPAGLTFEKTTGLISGTPAATASKAAYQVTAYSATGNVSIFDTITVNPAAPSIAYRHNPAVYLVNFAIVPDTLVNAGGPVDSFAVTPALPSGLSFSKSTGLITGTPTAASSKAAYMVTAYNVTASVAVYDTITVNIAAPAFTYKRNPATFIVGLTWKDTIVNTGGSIDKFTTTSPLPSGFSLDTTTGMITGTPPLSDIPSSAESVIDTLVVTGTNVSGSVTDTLVLNIKIKKPALTAYSVNPAIYVVGTSIIPNATSDTGGKVDSIKVSPALPSGLVLNDTTGAISGTPTAVAPKTGYTITAYNATGSMTLYDTITVNPAAPSIAYKTNPTIYSVNSRIPADSILNTGGAIDSFTVSPGLPAGLVLSKATGVITGTPTTITPKAAYMVTAYNVTASVSTFDTITVNVATPSFAYKRNPATFIVGLTWKDTIVNAGGLVAKFTTTSTLPSGFILDSTTGMVTGTPLLSEIPTLAESVLDTLLVKGTNITGSLTDTLLLNIKIKKPALMAYSANPAVYAVGTTITPNTTSDTGGKIDSIEVTPALPAGLTLSSSTGAITGTPSSVAPKASYTITAYNATGSMSVFDTITVNPASPLIAYRSNPSVYIVNSPITPDSVLNAGGAVDSFTVAPGLPTGLTLDKVTGVISGTPTLITLKAAYTVTAFNVTGNASIYDTITVNPVAPSVSFKHNPSTFIVGTLIPPDTLVNAGGPVDSVAVSPTLPGGLTLSKTSGTITGTPTAVTAKAAYRVTAYNATAAVSVYDTITVNPALPGPLTYKNGSGIYTTAITILPDTLVNPGGAVDSFTVAPALPPGLTLSKTSGIITGTATAAAPKQTYLVTGYNVTGSAFVYDTITVNLSSPGPLAYVHNPAVFIQGIAILPDTLANAGGPADSFTVAPSLPSGLTLIKTTGLITGTATTVMAKAAYKVTGINAMGSSAVYDTITINPPGPGPFTYKHNPAVYVANSALAPDTLVNAGGPVDSFSVAPALPAGLTLNKTTGVIAGIPTVAAAKQTYQVTGYNATGSAFVNDTLTVNPSTPGPLTYRHDPVVYIVNSAIVPDTMTNAGGTADSFTVAPALPVGLTLNRLSGLITGTPLIVTGKQAYLVTAYNITGSASVNDTVTINPTIPGPLAYMHNPITYGLSSAVSPDTLVNAGGAADSFTVTPALPAGLTLNRSTGLISGTPVALTSKQGYKITATNATGVAFVYDTITVSSGTAVIPRSFMVKAFSLNGSSGLLRYALPKQSFVSIRYYDYKGCLIGSFVNSFQDAGYYSLLVPTSAWAHGSYIQVFKAGEFDKTERFAILR